jgi:ATP-dependent RNA/DNA helicase IGHMBP2
MKPTTIENLLKCITLEETEEKKRYHINEETSIKKLKAEGLVLYPFSITSKNYGYADYPELGFTLHFSNDAQLFRDGVAIEMFKANEVPVKGILNWLNGKKGEVKLYAPDFPDWIEDDGVAIKLTPDMHTHDVMRQGLRNIANHKPMQTLFAQIHSTDHVLPKLQLENQVLDFQNKKLNSSQQQAIANILQNEQLLIVHGPPGTGKTTTLAEAIFQLVKKGQKVVVAAPSNTAVDNIAKAVLKYKIEILRVGNVTKIDEEIFKHTPEGKLKDGKQWKEIKDLKIRAEQFRKMAFKYKRSFGKAERDQRNLLFNEVKKIRVDIKKLQQYNEEKLYDDAQVVLGTPVALFDADLKKSKFNTLLIDEAGQCLEPLAWCIFPLASNYVLAGDYLQLPPTILSREAAQLGFDISILERCIPATANTFLLDTQYRMRKSIADFSNQYFYESKLITPDFLQDHNLHLTFIDTAGSGFNETTGADGTSLLNEGEVKLAHHIIANLQSCKQIAFVSPYSGQVGLALEQLPKTVRVSTIDSFQGQESEAVVLSLVRSNDDSNIGFLKDYRRMNVALTRAKEHLVVIGDSATLGQDKFYSAFLTFVEKNGAYKTVWEFDLF